MSECQGKDCSHKDHEKPIEPEIVNPGDALKSEPKEKPKIPKIQYIFITLADGRRGVFAGPELISEAELKLKPPVLADLIFSEPKEKTDLAPSKPAESKKATDDLIKP